MKLRMITFALQAAVIVLISFGASHVFQQVDTIIEFNGIHVYRYIAYTAAVILCYFCISKYNRYLAFSLSFSFSILAILGQQRVIDSFPPFAFFSAILMGVFAFILVPAAKGRGFVEFLFVLILPALFAESRLGRFILPASEGIFAYEVYAVTIAVVGGYFFLRYVASTYVIHQEFLSRGANEEDIYAINRWSSFITGAIVAVAVATTSLLATAALILMNTSQPYLAAIPLHIILLEIIIGGVIATIVYYFNVKT